MDAMEPIINAPGDPPMPVYKCHKIVGALRIQRVDPLLCDGEHIGATIVPWERGFHPFQVSQKWCLRHNPEAGGYYVVYDDGYQSYSPRKAFEAGYDRIDAQLEARRQSAAGEEIHVNAGVAAVEVRAVKP